MKKKQYKGAEAELKTSHLHCRTKPSDKAQYVRQARREGLPLCTWIAKTLDRAS